MKKAFLFVAVTFSTFAYAGIKEDLETAIRSLDVATVRQIVTHEKLTRQEYERYLNLAEEIVRHREAWSSKIYPMYDAETTYDGPSIKRLVPEVFIGWIGFKFGMNSAISLIEATFTEFGRQHDDNRIWAACTIVGFSVAGKVLYDLKKRFEADNAYKDLLRKKYDDAVVIKQLVYMANIVEA